MFPSDRKTASRFEGPLGVAAIDKLSPSSRQASHTLLDHSRGRLHVFPTARGFAGPIIIAAPTAVEHECHQTTPDEDRKKHAKTQRDPAMNTHVGLALLPRTDHEGDRQGKEGE